MSHPFRLLLAVAGALLLMCSAPPGVAAQGSTDTEELAQLKARVEQHYRVAVLRSGIVLVPRAASSTSGSIEITDDGVLIDGTPVTGAELRDTLPRDAAAIARLSLLDGRARRMLFAVEAPAPPVTPAPPSPPETPPVVESPDQPDDWVERDRYQRGGARVRIGGDVWVKEDEWVGDAVVAVAGSARVDGRVDGDVVAVGGGVHLGPKAYVRGQVVSVGGGVERAAGSRVGGGINEVRIGMPSFSPRIRFWPRPDFSWLGTSLGATTDLIATLARMAILTLLVVALATVLPVQVKRVGDRVAAEPWRAGFVGLAAQLLFVPVLIITVLILAISIIGIPLLLLVPFGVLAFLVAFLMGFAGAAGALGHAVTRRFGGSPLKLVLAVLVGLAIIWALTVIARFAGLAGLPVRIILSVVLVTGFIVEYAAWTVGLGGALISRFGRKDVPGAIAPPPIPAPPPGPSVDMI
jgi:hypothetical protein